MQGVVADDSGGGRRGPRDGRADGAGNLRRDGLRSVATPRRRGIAGASPVERTAGRRQGQSLPAPPGHLAGIQSTPKRYPGNRGRLRKSESDCESKIDQCTSIVSLINALRRSLGCYFRHQLETRAPLWRGLCFVAVGMRLPRARHAPTSVIRRGAGSRWPCYERKNSTLPQALQA